MCVYIYIYMFPRGLYILYIIYSLLDIDLNIKHYILIIKHYIFIYFPRRAVHPPSGEKYMNI